MEDGLSSSDVLALTRNNDGFGEGFTGIFGLLILLGIMGGGGFGWNNRPNDFGYRPQYATQTDVQYTSQFGQLLDGNRDIMTQANNNTNNVVNAITQSEYETVASMKDAQLQLQDRISALQVGQADTLARFNDVIGNTRLEIANQSAGINQNLMQNRYEGALNTDKITNAILLDGQKTRDILAGNRVADMQNQINQLQLQAQMANVLRFPNQWTYAGGFFPPIMPPTTTTGGTTTG